VTVTFYGNITRYTNGDKTFIAKNHSTLRDLLNELSDNYGENLTAFIDSRDSCLILINGKGIMLSGGLDSPLDQNDKIDILPFVDAG